MKKIIIDSTELWPYFITDYQEGWAGDVITEISEELYKECQDSYEIFMKTQEKLRVIYDNLLDT